MIDISPARRFTALERLLVSKAAAGMFSAVMGSNERWRGLLQRGGQRMLWGRGDITGGRELNRSRGE